MKRGEVSQGGKLNGVYKPGRINQQHQQFTQQHEEGTFDISGKTTKFTFYLSWHRSSA
jgi:hypothetical protein